MMGMWALAWGVRQKVVPEDVVYYESRRRDHGVTVQMLKVQA